MDGMFIRKDIDDYALGNIRFHESIGSPDFLTGIEGGNGWKITADGGIEGESAVIRSDAIIGNSIGSRDFASGMFGYGWRIDPVRWTTGRCGRHLKSTSWFIPKCWG